jgi:hypothetical protein
VEKIGHAAPIDLGIGGVRENCALDGCHQWVRLN